MTDNQSDLEIVHSVLEGDSSSYAILVDRYKDYAFTIAIRVMNNSEDAEEVAQDLCLIQLSVTNENKKGKL